MMAINTAAILIQWSAIAPAFYVINSADLSAANLTFKYADDKDTYIVIPSVM